MSTMMLRKGRRGNGKQNWVGVNAPLPKNVLGTVTTQSTMRAIITAVKAGVGKKLVMLGDSMMAGYPGLRTLSGPSIARALIQAAGVACRSDAWFGNAGMGTTAAEHQAYNPNVVFGAGWDFQQWDYFLGGCYWSTDNGDALSTYTPEKAANRFDFYVATAPGSGTLVVREGATVLGTIDTNIASAPTKFTITRAVATTNPITFQHNGTGGVVYLNGIEPWNSTLAELRIINLGVTGVASAFYTATGGALAKDMLDTIAGNFHIIEFAANDKATSVPLATFQTNMQTLITQSNARGQGTMLCVQVACRVDQPWNLTAPWQDAIKALAVSNGLTCVNLADIWGTYELRPDLYADLLHANTTGYALQGKLFADAILW